MATLYVQSDLVKKFGENRIADLVLNFLSEPSEDVSTYREVKAIEAMTFKSCQGGLYVSHPSLNLEDEPKFIEFLFKKAIWPGK